MVFDSAADGLPEALKTAALAGDLEAVAACYTALPVDLPQKRNDILMGIAECAAGKRHVELIEMCFTTGLHIPRNMTNTAVYHQAMDSTSKGLWGILMKQGLDLNVTYSEACGDVFSEAVREGDVELVRFLLEDGQDPNVAQGSGYDGLDSERLVRARCLGNSRPERPRSSICC